MATGKPPKDDQRRKYSWNSGISVAQRSFTYCGNTIMSTEKWRSEASRATYYSLSGAKHRSVVVTTELRTVDNQMTSGPHLVVRTLRLNRSTAATKSQAKGTGTQL